MSFTSKITSQGISSTLGHFATRARAANSIATFATAGMATIGAGAVAGGVLGNMWDSQSRANTGAMAGVGAFAAGAVGFALTKGHMRAGSLKGLISRENAAGHLLQPMAFGMGASLIAGQFSNSSNSTLTNLAIGAGTGIAGARMGRTMGKVFGGNMSRNFTFGKGARMLAGKGFNYNVTSVGQTAGAIFSPVMAHSLIGSTRNDKRKNTLNRF